MLLLLSFFNVIYGLAALANEDWAVLASRSILLLDLTALGWTLLIIGVIQLLVGFGVMAGSALARFLAIIGAFLNATVNIAWLSVYPLWSLLIITLDVLVIYGLMAHGDEVA
jgi:uncharacterized BrkB/YihY/UPF0761 family membrane protein